MHYTCAAVHYRTAAGKRIRLILDHVIITLYIILYAYSMITYTLYHRMTVLSYMSNVKAAGRYTLYECTRVRVGIDLQYVTIRR